MRYQVRVSTEPEDPAWDAFLARTPGGHHVQTSLWAQVKAVVGWRATRVVVTRGEQVVAGAQLLIRSVPLAGAICCVPRGPLISATDPSLSALVMEQIHEIARLHSTRYLAVQPPTNGEMLARQLSLQGFRRSLVELVPTATILLDLTRELDEILAQMKSKTRYNVRLGLRKGITVRDGGEADLRIFHHLLTETGRRQNFSPEPEEFFVRLWHLFNPYDHIKLFLAEYQGQAVSAALVIPFGDTVIYKRGAWSGQHGQLRPNEVMHWEVIRWARANGYRYYDLEGVDGRIAQAIVSGDHAASPADREVSSFKLGFGGQVALFPSTYDYIYNSLLRWTYDSLFHKVAGSKLVTSVLDRLRRH